MKNKNLPGHRKGQTMVEFALVFPVLLLIILGLLEAGRLVFIYGSLTTASRQAVRYGSATGDNGAGTDTRKYLDCTGIQAAAQDMGFIFPIETVDIVYTREGETFADCDMSSRTYPNPTADIFRNGDRIEVTTRSAYAPIIPIAGFANFPLISESKRTILVGIQISAEPAPWVPPTSIQLEGFARSISPSITSFANSNTYSVEGEEIEFKFILTNTGETDLTSYSIETDIGNCSDSDVTIFPDDPVECILNYTITSDNYINKETFTIKADAEASDGISTTTASTSVIVNFEPTAQISLRGEVNPAAKTTEGPVIFTYTITNIGNMDLTTFSVQTLTGAPVSFTCDTGILPAQGADTILCSGTYTITQDDLAAGLVTNEAKATATDGGLNSSTEIASATVITKPLKLTITTNPLEYDITSDTGVEFNYTLENVGDVPLSDLSLTSALFGNVTVCNNGVSLSATTLALKGDKVSCKMVYAPISQTDMDNGYLDDDATGYAEDGTIASNTEEESILAKISTGLLLEVTNPIDKSVIPYRTTTITYTYKLTNTGNVTLKEAYEIRDSDNTVLCAGTFRNLAPGSSDTSCSYTYNIVAPDDWNAGSIISTVTAYTQYTPPNPPYTNPTPISVPSKTVKSTVYTYDGDRMTLELTSSSGSEPVSIDDLLIFTYTLTNTGSTTLYPDEITNDYPIENTASLTNHDLSTCGKVLTPVEPGDLIKVCTMFYTVAEADTSGAFLVNSATATSKTVSAAATLALDVIELPDCAEDQWTSSTPYVAGDPVYHCTTGTTCYEWEATLDGINHKPGINASLPYWDQVNRCSVKYACQLSVTSVSMSNFNSYTQSFSIVNASGASVEIGGIGLSWVNKRSNSPADVSTIMLGTDEIYPGTSGGITIANGGFVPASPWTIGPGTTPLTFTFTQRTNSADAALIFSDNLCLDESLP